MVSASIVIPASEARRESFKGNDSRLGESLGRPDLPTGRQASRNDRNK